MLHADLCTISFTGDIGAFASLMSQAVVHHGLACRNIAGESSVGALSNVELMTLLFCKLKNSDGIEGLVTIVTANSRSM